MTSADLYEYDASGNRTKKTEQRQGVTDVIITNTYNNMNQLVSSHNSGTGTTTTYTYDDVGNLTNDGTTSYYYNELQRLRSSYGDLGSASYEYYSDGLRRCKDLTCYIWLDGNYKQYNNIFFT